MDDIKKHMDLLYRYALVRVSDHDTAMDLVQETLTSALKSNFQGKSKISTWLVGILKHKLMDHYRKIFRESPLGGGADPQVMDSLIDPNGKWTVPLNKWTPSPERIFEDKEFRKTLDSCIQGLPEKARHVFVLKELDGMKSKDICKHLGITATNLWVILHRTRERLRKCIDDHWFNRTNHDLL